MIPENRNPSFHVQNHLPPPRGMLDLKFLHVDNSSCKMTIEVVWHNSQRSGTNILWDMAGVVQMDIKSNYYYIREFPRRGGPTPTSKLCRMAQKQWSNKKNLGSDILGQKVHTVPFQPSVHDFGKFRLREGRRIIFWIKANFKTARFFDRDVWLNTWSKWYSITKYGRCCRSEINRCSDWWY